MRQMLCVVPFALVLIVVIGLVVSGVVLISASLSLVTDATANLRAVAVRPGTRRVAGARTALA